MYMTGCERAILSTILYYDLYEYPLTAEEIYRYLLWSEAGSHTPVFHNIVHALDTSSVLARYTVVYEGYRVVRGREKLVRVRQERYQIAERKYRRAGRVASLLAAVPFIRMIAIANTLSLSNARDESDIDLFIIAQHGHLWLVRGICIMLLEFLRLRPTDVSQRDTICLSFFASTAQLNLSRLQLAPSQDGVDIYLATWIAHCVPLYQHKAIYEDFYRANAWIETWVPHRLPHHTHPSRTVRLLGIARWAKKLCECILAWNSSWLEARACRIQLAVMPERLRTLANVDTRVVLNDFFLKFHPNDRRAWYRAQWALQRRLFGV